MLPELPSQKLNDAIKVAEEFFKKKGFVLEKGANREEEDQRINKRLELEKSLNKLEQDVLFYLSAFRALAARGVDLAKHIRVFKEDLAQEFIRNVATMVRSRESQE